MTRVNLQFSQVELKVGPTLAHGMMPLDRKVKLMEEGHNCNYGKLKRQDKNSCLLKMKKAKKKTCRRKNRGDAEARFFIFLEREREHILSRFLANPTVEFRRSKKASCSTRRGLPVDSAFRSFRQLPRGRIFSYFVYF